MSNHMARILWLSQCRLTGNGPPLSRILSAFSHTSMGTNTRCGCLVDYRFVATWAKRCSRRKRRSLALELPLKHILCYTQYMACMAILLYAIILGYLKPQIINSPGRYCYFSSDLCTQPNYSR
ncbi:hypothetical protein ASPWEDRAFT_401020 [Aspergillus wentii DTO 134E9]|uniref:Uncharacterized protein n=1 Tax=Aspergillus wentii DTO 134E9 TaxID=1073089 RepID=A0A1L9RYK3_ASPWE|nr:uncharacterized protein ASPWEDRAFT_401020 [Aspergillus wentii DTO 134E9]OJJ39898.1 hypothetical protein ASPWEDRAFT_401020 [Aspergillus wentii DTO 134E9]